VSAVRLLTANDFAGGAQGPVPDGRWLTEEQAAPCYVSGGVGRPGSDTASPSERAIGPTTPRFRDGVPFCLGVFVAVRVLLSLVAVIGVRNHSPGADVVGAAGQGSEQPATSGWHNAFDGTVRWDAVWYIAIVRDGYDATGRGATFYPGYPIVARAVDRASPLGPTTAALVVSNVSFFGALVVLYALTRREFSEQLARRTVVLVAIFPTSFFFLAPYSESLFLLSTLLSFWWARRDRWVLAGLAGAVAAITRSIGIVLIPCLLLEAFSKRPHAAALRTRVLGSLVPMLSPVAYALWWLGRTGDALQPLHAQASWMRSLTFPVFTLANAIALGSRGIGDPVGIYWTGDLLLTAALLVPLTIAWRRLPLPYLTYASLSFLVPLTLPLSARPLVSVPRYEIVVFPAFWALALLTDRPVLRRVVLVLSTAGFVIAALAFMNWGFLF